MAAGAVVVLPRTVVVPRGSILTTSGAWPGTRSKALVLPRLGQAGREREGRGEHA